MFFYLLMSMISAFNFFMSATIFFEYVRSGSFIASVASIGFLTLGIWCAISAIKED